MARLKRSSRTLQKAEKREAGLQSISPTLDLGNQLTLAKYADLIQSLRSQIATYNSDLSSLDDLSRQIKDAEQQMRNLSEQMLLGVAAKYGKDSGEYGKAGGVLKSEHRRPARKNAADSNGELLTAMVVPTAIKTTGAEPMNGKALLSN
jgi:uncharacterized protein YoxC